MKMTMQTRTKEKTVQAAFDEFLLIKRNENLSEDTIKDYSSIFAFFMDFYGKESLCKEITEDTVQDYIAYLREKPKKKNNPNSDSPTEFLSSATIATYVRHLRAVLNVFMERGYMDKFTVKVPRFDKEVKEVYTSAELDKLLEKPDLKTCSFSEYRNWVMTNYFLSTANRVSTAINLKIKDLDFVEDRIYLRKVKNKNAYIIPMNKRLKKVFIEYLSYRKGESDDYLFCSENDDKKPLSRESAKTAIHRYNSRRGVAKTSMHIYRNTFAKFYLLHGGVQMNLKTILGHKTLSMVQEYVNMYGKDLDINFDVCNPLSEYDEGERVLMTK